MQIRYRLSLLMSCVLMYSQLNGQTPTFSFNGSADVVFRYPPRGSGGRAFVHDDSNVLTLNYGGDFSGGLRIGSNINIDVSGNVGIGTIYNNGSLNVNGTSIFGNQNGTSYDENIRLPSSIRGYACIALGATPGISGTGPGQWSLMKFPESLQSKFSIRHGGDDYLEILPNGNVGIGTSNPTEKLAVNGKLRAHEIRVETSNWPDYVFEPDYQLTSLKDLENYIVNNKHLPDVPTAKDAELNGVELGQMNKILLKKIEEITIHLIDLKKSNDILFRSHQELQKEVLRLKKKN